MARPVPMNRLLQGDVGSGKTAVAGVAMALALQAGSQAAIMAPTAILAEQHYRTLSRLLAPVLGEDSGALRLLLGSTPAAEKEAVYAGLRSGEVRAVVGTHALIEGPVEFANLGLVVVDEQHRFGVAQRAALRAKGANPHLLVMTATPIPRSLALTVYGDLDLTLLDEMPPGRQPIQTVLWPAKERERGYAFIRSQVDKGRQAFVIFPLVEESEKIDAKAAVTEHERLQTEIFPDYRLGLLHGRMRPDEKDEVMSRFRAGDYQVLVSTSVVEVGVDVPNATVILIEGANRFGLAQLHQFRGRVGRGEHRSYCVLISDAPNAEQDERLKALVDSQDGFYLAEKDLELRGPGDFLGTRQSGFAGLNMARLSDLPTVEKARREARLIFEQDPDLQAAEHGMLAERLAAFWAPGSGDAS
jgi:ATP-dependent DNA helicase RecG